MKGWPDRWKNKIPMCNSPFMRYAGDAGELEEFSCAVGDLYSYAEWVTLGMSSQVMNFEHVRETMIHCMLQMTREGSYWLLLLGDQLDKGRWQSSHTNDSNNKKICSILEQMLLNSECISPQKYIRIIWFTHWWMYSSEKNSKFLNFRKNCLQLYGKREK